MDDKNASWIANTYEEKAIRIANTYIKRAFAAMAINAGLTLVVCICTIINVILR